jgi:hypothetical protein
VVDDSIDSSPRAGTSNSSEKYGLDHRLLEMGGIGGRGSSLETAIRRVNVGITIR